MGRSTVNVGLFVTVVCNVVQVASQQCAAGSAAFIEGNWYCQPVKAITYRNFPGFGDYDKVIGMDVDTGQCEIERYEYSGSLSPLNDELSLHIRGPTWLHEMAVYFPKTSSHDKRHNQKAGVAGNSHGHHHLHRHGKAGSNIRQKRDAHTKRAVGDLVIATIDGQQVSWINSYSGPPAPLPESFPTPNAANDAVFETVIATTFVTISDPLPESFPTQNAADDAIFETVIATTFVTISGPCPTTSTASISQDSKPFTSSIATSAPLPSDDHKHTSTGSWVRQAYYNAASGYSKGFTFLNHHGDTHGASGTSEGGAPFGASLSYASCDAKTAARSPQILENALLSDGVEIAVFSDKSCDDGGCGFTRPNNVAYHGFGGSSKIFLLKFTMPFTGTRGFNGDMPAIWLLNAQIPHTSQYGTNPHCSCWTTGCGELDLFEVLDPGNFRCKSSLHMAPAGGCSEYFVRPSQEPITAAVVFSATHGVVSLRILDEGEGAFGEGLEEELVEEWLKGVVDGEGEEWSVFDLGV